MSMGAALKAAGAVALATRVVAVELLLRARAIDLLAPLTTSAPLARVHAAVRTRVARRAGDHPPSRDIEAIAATNRRRRFDHIERPGRQLIIFLHATIDKPRARP